MIEVDATGGNCQEATFKMNATSIEVTALDAITVIMTKELRRLEDVKAHLETVDSLFKGTPHPFDLAWKLNNSVCCSFIWALRARMKTNAALARIAETVAHERIEMTHANKIF